MISDEEDLPELSVIIPVYNRPEKIRTCIEGVLNQTYPEELTEIYVVDNKSTDQTREVVKEYSRVNLEKENEIQSSYAARNTGIEACEGHVIAMIDSDCDPVDEWLENGVKKMIETDADLVGGNVEFTFSKRRKASELYDSINNMQVESDIKGRGVAKTANLFSKRKVFDEIGLFPEDVKSGGDVTWTRKATENNFKLVYSKEAKVRHPARRFISSMKKQFRVGKGKYSNDEKSKDPMKILKRFNPPKISYLKSKLEEKVDSKVSKQMFARLFLVVWMVNVFQNLGFIYGLFNDIRRIK